MSDLGRGAIKRINWPLMKESIELTFLSLEDREYDKTEFYDIIIQNYRTLGKERYGYRGAIRQFARKGGKDTYRRVAQCVKESTINRYGWETFYKRKYFFSADGTKHMKEKAKIKRNKND